MKLPASWLAGFTFLVVVGCATTLETQGIGRTLNRPDLDESQRVPMVLIFPAACLFNVVAYGIAAAAGRRKGYVERAQDLAIKHVPVMLERRLREPRVADLNQCVLAAEDAERRLKLAEGELEAFKTKRRDAKRRRGEEQTTLDAARAQLLNDATFGVERWTPEEIQLRSDLLRKKRRLEEDLHATEAASAKLELDTYPMDDPRSDTEKPLTLDSYSMDNSHSAKEEHEQ